MRKSAVAIVAAAILSAPVLAKSLDYPTKAYDAIFDRTSEEGSALYRQASDGKGHMRVEAELPSAPGHQIQDRHKTVMLMDYTQHKRIVLLPGRRMALTAPMLVGQSGANIDNDRIKFLGGKALGTKVIDGHPCHGWEYNDHGSTVVQWTGDDTGCVIESVVSTKRGKLTTHLKKYVAGPPDPSEFTVPEGFKITEAPVGGRSVRTQ